MCGGTAGAKIFSGLVHKKNNTVEFDEELQQNPTSACKIKCLQNLPTLPSCGHRAVTGNTFLFPEIPKLCLNTTTGSN